MIALGIDVSTRKLAIAGLREDGTITHHALSLDPDRRGARRLREARTTAWAVLDGYRLQDVCCVVVEIPWAANKSNFALLAIAGVVMEAAQAALPQAVILDVPTPSWKSETVGHGNATKLEVGDHAAGLGYDGSDQDVADALCMAQMAWDRWSKVAA
jgi:Holliday junction resolvasome RuvABC endonuclease subunit